VASGEGAPRQQGILAVWNDDRGFGFVTPTAGGPRVFVHVSAFPPGRRPDTDCLVTYAVGRDERNRLRASDVRYVVPVRSRRTGTRGLRPALFTTAMFFTGLVALVVAGRLPGLLLVAYGIFSVGAFAMYRADKTAAQQGAWRTPETNLHAIALLGGWPGALVARRVFRHKTTKQPFRTVFWGTVITNCLALAWFVHDAPRMLG